MTRAKSGGKGIRTPGLLIANETLYQLSYTPGKTERSMVQRFFHEFKLSSLACALISRSFQTISHSYQASSRQ